MKGDIDMKDFDFAKADSEIYACMNFQYFEPYYALHGDDREMALDAILGEQWFDLPQDESNDWLVHITIDTNTPRQDRVLCRAKSMTLDLLGKPIKIEIDQTGAFGEPSKDSRYQKVVIKSNLSKADAIELCAKLYFLFGDKKSARGGTMTKPECLKDIDLPHDIWTVTK